VFDPQLSRVRTILFGAMTLVWFSEMLFLGLEPLSKVWAYLWQVPLPQTPQDALAMFIIGSTTAPAKGALCVMAIAGLLSKNPATRTALFISMALIPPLNIAFPFRHQGFLLGPVTIATVLSAILWGSYFLFREPTRKAARRPASESVESPLSGWEILQYVWFGFYSALLTVLAFFLLFWPSVAPSLILPCLPLSLTTNETELSSLIHTSLGSGTHMLAIATGFWIATVSCRSNPGLRGALTVAGAVHAGFFLVFPLRSIALGFGGTCATASIPMGFLPLFVAWVIFAAYAYRAAPPSAAALAR